MKRQLLNSEGWEAFPVWLQFHNKASNRYVIGSAGIEHREVLHWLLNVIKRAPDAVQAALN
jgi:hypothetical protein